MHVLLWPPPAAGEEQKNGYLNGDGPVNRVFATDQEPVLTE